MILRLYSLCYVSSKIVPRLMFGVVSTECPVSVALLVLVRWLTRGVPSVKKIPEIGEESLATRLSSRRLVVMGNITICCLCCLCSVSFSLISLATVLSVWSVETLSV